MVSRAFSTILFFALVAGCEARADDDPPALGEGDAPSPIAIVHLANGSTVEFYEPSPGRIAISETGPIANTFSFSTGDLATRTPLDLYRALPDAPPPPPALVEADKRRAQLARQRGIAHTSQALGTGMRAASCDDAYTRTSVGSNFGGAIGSRETSHTERVYDENFYQFVLCIPAGQTGSVSMDAYTRSWLSWTKQGYWVTYPGTYRWWSYDDAWVDFDAQTRFWNGSALVVDYYVDCYPANYNCWS